MEKSKEELYKEACKAKHYQKQWISNVLIPVYSDEEYRKIRSEVREVMELNMVMYGKW